MNIDLSFVKIFSHKKKQFIKNVKNKIIIYFRFYNYNNLNYNNIIYLHFYKNIILKIYFFNYF